MNLNRREFLARTAAVSAGSAITLSTSAWAAKPQGPTYSDRPLAILQGVTSETFTQFAIDLPKSLVVRYEIVDGEKSETVPSVQSYSPSYAQERVDHLHVKNLDLGKTYLLRVYDQQGLKLDEREFKTLDTKKSKAKVALLSCQNDLSKDEVIAAMSKNLEEAKPELMLFLGDNVYGDMLAGFVAGPSVLWSRYRKGRAAFPLYHWRKLVPTIAIWDDHDFGKNDAVGNYKHASSSLEHFRSAYAQADIPGLFEKGAGVSSTLELFNHRFVFLDGKSWRDDQHIIGSTQLDWMIEQSKKSGQGLVVCMGTSFLGKENERSIEFLAKDEFANFQRALTQMNKPTLQVSGDLHYSEISDITQSEYGHEGFHITSSCFHSIQKKQLRENAIRKKAALMNNFIMLEFKGVGSYEAKCIGQDKVNFETTLTI